MSEVKERWKIKEIILEMIEHLFFDTMKLRDVSFAMRSFFVGVYLKMGKIST